MASYLKFASFLRLKNNFAPKSGQHLLLTSDLQEHLLHRRTNPVLNKLVNVFLKLLVRLFQITQSHWVGHSASSGLCGFNPFRCNLFDVLESFFLGLPIGHTAWQFADYGDIGTVFLAPNNVHRVFVVHFIS